ncbi:hypothetical protein [Tengunoibacter tsumagoiensis]|uniref:Uncharacterized protein n=1 Tax=Tengunoibacter tsumagoiensis TaxID=2014871 RepID=A0A402A8L7_9CHLR|nr:hypothetical protein [Tengunoibacter tsumagoiensis]GCE15301.1 hypothetical protein KTT_51600 [Tengunoibacter tsumagoiensis]
MENEAIRLYCGQCEKRWNYHAPATGPFACISPVTGNTTTSKTTTSVEVAPHTQVIQDSGAFSDGPGQRLSFPEALKQQERHAERFGYADRVTARASYDFLIDEMWDENELNGTFVRRKRRWSEGDARDAVEETVQAAAFLSQHRNGLSCLLSAQGVSALQYLDCAQRVLAYFQPEDTFALGGWCITGKMPAQIMPHFRETMYRLIPFLGGQGVKRIHIWGVCYAPALGELLWLCDQWGIALSTDSVGPSIQPVRGIWGYAEWRMKPGMYHQPPVRDSCKTGHFDQCQGCRGLERARHTQATRLWLADFRQTPWYPRQDPQYLNKPRQLTLAV